MFQWEAGIQITRSMALNHAHDCIRINAMCPGVTLVQRWVEKSDFAAMPLVKVGLEALGEAIPMHRIGTPLEIIKAVQFLASDEASIVTGVVLPVMVVTPPNRRVA